MRLSSGLLILILALLLLGGCCLSSIFDDNEINPGPHEEGAAGDDWPRLAAPAGAAERPVNMRHTGLFLV